MLAKRIVIAAFAILAMGLAPLAFSGERDLFVDLEPTPQVIAEN